MQDLELQKELAKAYADRHDCPMKIVKPDYAGGYNICPLDQKTGCEVVWTTEDPEPVEQDIFQPEPKPIVHKNEDKLHKLEALQKKLQDKIDKLKEVQS